MTTPEKVREENSNMKSPEQLQELINNMLSNVGEYCGETLTAFYMMEAIQVMKDQSSIIDGLRNDAERIKYLANELNAVDTIYFEDGKIIDVGGNHQGDLRAAIDAAIATLSSPGESNNG